MLKKLYVRAMLWLLATIVPHLKIDAGQVATNGHDKRHSLQIYDGHVLLPHVVISDRHQTRDVYRSRSGNVEIGLSDGSFRLSV